LISVEICRASVGKAKVLLVGSLGVICSHHVPECGCKISILSGSFSCLPLEGPKKKSSLCSLGQRKTTDPGACDNTSVRITKFCFSWNVGPAKFHQFHVDAPVWCIIHPPQTEGFKSFWYQNYPAAGWLVSPRAEVTLFYSWCFNSFFNTKAQWINRGSENLYTERFIN
jgi:hypothetical protein